MSSLDFYPPALYSALEMKTKFLYFKVTFFWTVIVLWPTQEVSVLHNLNDLNRSCLLDSHHGFLVGFLDGVTCDLTVTVVLWRLPLQCNIETPDINDLQSLRVSW